MPAPSSLSPINIAALDQHNFKPIELVSEELRQTALSGVVADWARSPPFYAYRSGLAVTVCARARDLKEMYTSPDRFTVVAPAFDAYKIFDLFGGLESVLQMDGERHTRIRGLMSPAFTPAAVQKLSGAIQAIVDEKIDRILRGQGRFDAMADFATDIIVRVLLEASFRLTPTQQQAFIAMNDSISLATSFEPGKPLPVDFLRAVTDVQTVIAEVVADRRENPGEDMLSHLVMARYQGQGLNEVELFGQINSICSAALGTTAATIGGALYTLISHPDQLELLRREPQLIDAAVEECLRFHGPGIFTFTRFATRDTEIAGVKIPQHMPVIGSIQAASYDPEVFPDPLRFDIRRGPVGILSFGSGPHHCIGNRLGRLIMKKSILGIIERIPGLRFADPDFKPVYGGFPGELSLLSLPLCFSHSTDIA
jgi:cytochrome P450